MKIKYGDKFSKVFKYTEAFQLNENALNAMFEKLEGQKLKEEYSFDLFTSRFGVVWALFMIMSKGDKPFINVFKALYSKPNRKLLCFTLSNEYSDKKIMNMKAGDALAVIKSVIDQIERIGEMFEAIRHEPTHEEIQAGIQEINHGFEGIADWYARRMGIADIRAVQDVPFNLIYSAMKIDADNAKVQRNLNNILSKKR